MADACDSVDVWVPPADGEVTIESPGTLRLRLAVSSKGMRVLDDAARERGRIDAAVPKLLYTMYREGGLIWKLSARSIVLRRHAVQFSPADSWLFHTPWYCWLNILGVHCGEVKVVGWVGPNRRYWALCIDPGCDNLDLLSLLALLHRNWWRS
jgi:hypothetical protein